MTKSKGRSHQRLFFIHHQALTRGLVVIPILFALIAFFAWYLNKALSSKC